jgi:hypothetical protein
LGLVTEGPWTSVTNQWGDMGYSLSVIGMLPLVVRSQVNVVNRRASALLI